MSEVKNNHVQLSKFLMKPFAHKTQDGKKVYYLDIQTGRILEEKINKLGTKPEYYYPETEDFLNKEVENKVGDVYRKLKDVAKDDSNFQLTGLDFQNIKRLFSYALIRGEKYQQEMKKSSTYPQFLHDKLQTELIIRTPQHVEEFFNGNFVNILVNKSGVDFVLPHSCMYLMSSITKQPHEELKIWCMPISPKCSVLLIPNTHRDMFMSNGIIHKILITNYDEIRHHNDMALESEILLSNMFIVGDIPELERLSISFNHNILK